MKARVGRTYRSSVTKYFHAAPGHHFLSKFPDFKTPVGTACNLLGVPFINRLDYYLCCYRAAMFARFDAAKTRGKLKSRPQRASRSPRNHGNHGNHDPHTIPGPMPPQEKAVRTLK